MRQNQFLPKNQFLPNFWSGRRVSNSRPQPWQGCALPTELLPQLEFFFTDCLGGARRNRTAVNGFAIRCITTLLSRHPSRLLKAWSGRRVSNSRPQPWQGCALPTELLPHCEECALYTTLKTCQAPWKTHLPLSALFYGLLLCSEHFAKHVSL